MRDSTIILIFNAILYLGTLLIYQLRQKRITVGSVVLLLYSFVAIAAIYTFQSPLSVLVYIKFNDITIFPFAYLYVTLMMMFLPLLKFSDNKIKNLILPNLTIIKILSAITIILSLITFFIKLSNFNISEFWTVNTFLDNYENAQIEMQNDPGASYSFIGVINVLQRAFSELPLLLLAYNFIFIKNKFINIGLIFSILVLILLSGAKGGRWDLFKILTDTIFVYLFLRNFIDQKLKSRIIKALYSVLAIVSIAFISITAGRYSNRNNAEIIYSIASYTGQPFLYFNNYGLNAGGTRKGDTTMALYKKILGMETTDNPYRTRGKYDNLKMNNTVFYTFVGEFTLDFGPKWAFIILATIAALFSRGLYAKNSYDFAQVFLCFLLYKICVHGYCLFPFANLGVNLALLVLILIYFLIKKTTKIRFTK
jgi:oligosaccharide repeat unit polymerase